MFPGTFGMKCTDGYMRSLTIQIVMPTHLYVEYNVFQNEMATVSTISPASR
jgi:hypothetical protein